MTPVDMRPFKDDEVTAAWAEVRKARTAVEELKVYADELRAMVEHAERKRDEHRDEVAQLREERDSIDSLYGALREDNERLREALGWIVRVTATEREYKTVARAALDA